MIKAIDFFCGAGGLTKGLLKAGISVLAGVDNDGSLQETYTRNNVQSRFIPRDIKSVNIHELRETLDIQAEDVTLYAACTPCQPFSTLSRLKGEDKRKFLLLAFADIVEKCPPNFILVENVPGLNNGAGKEVYEKFMDVLERCGFAADADLLDAKHFGVPQTRKRFILVASRDATVSLPIPQIEADRFATVRESIKKYPVIADGEESKAYPNHVARKLQPHHKRIVEAVPQNGGSRRDVKDTSLLLACHQKNPDAHGNVFSRMAWDAPSPTLTCRCADVYSGRFVHPEQHRGISLREAAALQTFDDDYEFFGTSISGISRQIGNAVPVQLAKQLGKAIVDAVDTAR